MSEDIARAREIADDMRWDIQPAVRALLRSLAQQVEEMRATTEARRSQMNSWLGSVSV